MFFDFHNIPGILPESVRVCHVTSLGAHCIGARLHNTLSRNMFRNVEATVVKITACRMNKDTRDLVPQKFQFHFCPKVVSTFGFPIHYYRKAISNHWTGLLHWTRVLDY